MELKEIVTTVFGLAIVGMVVYFITTYIPMAPVIKHLITIIVVVAVIYFLINKFL